MNAAPLMSMSSSLMKLEDVVPQPEHEEWSDMIARITVPGRVAEVTEKTYDYFLEVLPPRLMRSSMFVFAEGEDPLTIFWQKEGKYYCRRLTDAEHDQACGRVTT